MEWLPAPEQVIVGFAMHARPSQIWAGMRVGPRDIALCWRGGRLYQRTSGASGWGSIALSRACLAAHGKALAGLELAPPADGSTLRPSRSAAARLRQLHGKACQLADTQPSIIARPEVARALENDLLDALVNCLTGIIVADQAAARRRHADIMDRLEDVLTARDCGALSMPELCAAIGVPGRTLRMCCTKFLGMSLGRYIRLRRLSLVRMALLSGDAAATTVGVIARRNGFSELGRMAADYRSVFGETPSTTLRRTVPRCN